MKALEQSEQNHRPRRGARPTSIHLVLNWTHMSVFVAVAAVALISLNQGFASVDQRIDDLYLRINDRFENTNLLMDDRFENMNLRMDDRFEDMNQRMDERFNDVERRIGRVETRLDSVEGELSDVNTRLSDIDARLAVVENIVGVQANADAESPPAAGTSDSDVRPGLHGFGHHIRVKQDQSNEAASMGERSRWKATSLKLASFQIDLSRSPGRTRSTGNSPRCRMIRANSSALFP